MTRMRVAGILGIAVAIVAAYILFFRHRDTAKPDKVAEPAKPAAADPWAHAAKTTDQKPQIGAIPQWTFDIDPEGPLTMEGQVVDADGHGVAGAEVVLGSVPTRTAKTEGDGTFSFD